MACNNINDIYAVAATTVQPVYAMAGSGPGYASNPIALTNQGYYIGGGLSPSTTGGGYNTFVQNMWNNFQLLGCPWWDNRLAHWGAQYPSITHAYHTALKQAKLDFGAQIKVACGCNTPISGCTNSLAVNYDPNATVDDGSCVLPSTGCMDPAASNHDPNCTVHDQSICTYAPGTGSCLSPGSWSYNPLGTTDCQGNAINSPAYNAFASGYGATGCCQPLLLGCMDSGLPSASAVHQHPHNFSVHAHTFNRPPTWTGPATNYNPNVNVNDTSSCVYLGTFGCTDPNAINYVSWAFQDDGSCVYPAGARPPAEDAGELELNDLGIVVDSDYYDTGINKPDVNSIDIQKTNVNNVDVQATDEENNVEQNY
jgi:hypothetical protein